MNETFTKFIDAAFNAIDKVFDDAKTLIDIALPMAQAITGIAAVVYIASKIYGHLSRAEPIDIYPLLRPFLIFLLIVFFKGIFIDGVGRIGNLMNEDFTELINDQADARRQIDQSLIQKEREYFEKRAKYDVDKTFLTYDDKQFAEYADSKIVPPVFDYLERGWYKFKRQAVNFIAGIFEFIAELASLIIIIFQKFVLLILGILGPLSIGISLFPGFSASLSSWISRYISISLWSPICALLQAILLKFQVVIKKSQLDILSDQIAAANSLDQLDNISMISYESLILTIVLSLLALACYMAVPTIAGWVVESGGGAGSLGRVVTSGLSSAAQKGGRIAGKSTGSAIGTSAAGIRSGLSFLSQKGVHTAGKTTGAPVAGTRDANTERSIKTPRDLTPIE